MPAAKRDLPTSHAGPFGLPDRAPARGLAGPGGAGSPAGPGAAHRSDGAGALTAARTKATAASTSAGESGKAGSRR